MNEPAGTKSTRLWEK